MSLYFHKPKRYKRELEANRNSKLQIILIKTVTIEPKSEVMC